jgi:hypothetical protein
MQASCRGASGDGARTGQKHARQINRAVLTRCLLAVSILFVASKDAHAQSGNGQTIRAVFGPTAVSNIVSSSSGPDPFSGEVINVVVGATRFYDEGYIGFGATVANIEAGNIWNGHESLGHVTTFLQDTISPGPQTGEFDRHATWVGAVIGGRPAFPFPGDYQVGIAPGADLWSGSIATTWVDTPYSASFDINLNTFATPYKTAMVTGVAGRTADVINSSWGFAEPTGAGSDFARGIDALVSLSGKTFVTVAGNEGPAGNTVESPAAGYNKIAVAALTSDTTIPPYSTVAPFSSRGPSDVFNPATNQIMIGVRATVDIAAPGTDLTLAYYGGTTGGNSPTLGPTSGTIAGNNFYASPLAGTSFAAPAVAGAAALVVDAARGIFGNTTKAIDGRVVKAILLNSADKIPGWNNGQANIGGVITTSQSLDYASGAGALNLNRAFDQLTVGTTDVLAPGGGPWLAGGIVQKTGWDFGRVLFATRNEYQIAPQLAAGDTLTVTLDWFINRTINLATNATAENIFNDLDLEVWRTTAGLPTTLVATSDSQYNNVEHLNFQLPATDTYLLRVTFAGNNWNLSGNPDATLFEDFGLAWNVTAVPEPSTIVLLMIGVAAVIRFRVRKQRTATSG